MEAIQKQELSPEVISSLVLNGDLSKLTPVQKVQYMGYRCKQLGLDIAAKPFELLKLNGKEVLYATSACTQQLCESRGLSTSFVGSDRVEDVLVVTAKVTDKDGRSTENVGAVSIGSLKGDALANALMKTRTKALRRAVLSHCGLGMLDETEIETIPHAAPVNGNGAQPAQVEAPVVEVHAEVVQGDASEPQKLDAVMVPLGPNKGKRMIDLTDDTLKKQLEWLDKNHKYPEYADQVRAYLNDPFLGALK